MTASDDFFPGDESQNANDASAYPVVFGIAFTPVVIGALVAVLGLLGAAYLIVTQVQPVWESNQKLQGEVEQKKQQVQQQAEIKKKIDAAKAKLVESQQQKQYVLALFAPEKSLDTLLVDVNDTINSRQGKLVRFEPIQQQGAITQPADVQNRLKRKVFNVEFEGNFDQTLSVLRNVERLSSLLEVKDFRVDLGGATPQKLVVDPQGRTVLLGQPQLKSTFKLQALVPLTSEEIAAATPAQPAKK